MGLFGSKSFIRRTRYVVNDQEYHSLDEMPANLRKYFEDQDGDGRPDWLDDELQGMMGRVASQRIEMHTVNGVTTYRVGDREYQGLDEMPPGHRALFEDRDGDGLPDCLPADTGAGTGSRRAGESGPRFAVSRPSSARFGNRLHDEYHGNGIAGFLSRLLLLLIVLAAMGVMMGGALWWFSRL